MDAFEDSQNTLISLVKSNQIAMTTVSHTKVDAEVPESQSSDITPIASLSALSSLVQPTTANISTLMTAAG